MLNTIDIELVAYDETEYFRDYNDPLFNYPYTPRKTKLSTLKFNIPTEGEDYDFIGTTMKFSRSSACLEGNWIDQLFFFDTLYESMIDLIDQNLFKIKEPE